MRPDAGNRNESAMIVMPHLMFQGNMAAALDLWQRAFPDLMRSGDNPCTVTFAGQSLRLFDSPPVHDFDFTPSFSLLVTCDSANEVRRLADILGADGKVFMPMDAYEFSPCYIWLADPFGVSWQIMQPMETE